MLNFSVSKKNSCSSKFGICENSEKINKNDATTVINT